MNGSVDYMFDRKGIFLIPKTDSMVEDDLTLALIDGGAEEVEFSDEYIEIICAMEDFGNIQAKLDELLLEAESAELQRIPTTVVTLGDEDFTKVMKLIEAFEDDDDVQKVYHNIEVTASQMEML